MSVAGVGEDMRVGQRAAFGSDVVSKRKKYPGNYIPK